MSKIIKKNLLFSDFTTKTVFLYGNMFKFYFNVFLKYNRFYTFPFILIVDLFWIAYRLSGTSLIFSKMAILICIPNINWANNFLHLLNIYHLSLLVLFYNSHSNRQTRIAHYGFNLHFPND